jgi:hypothetical protein
LTPVAGDPHRLRPDHHRTPFSAAEIREASTPGRVVRSIVARAGSEPFIRVFREVSGDAEGGERDVWTETLDGRQLSEPERGYSTWLELQGHASMPAATTTIEPETIDIPAGRFDCLRYTRVNGDEVDTFWFAISRPGAPVRFEKRVAGDLVFSSTAIEERHEAV